MRVAVVGLGAVGVRVARQLLATTADQGGPPDVVLVHRAPSRLTFVRHDLGQPVEGVEGGVRDLTEHVDVVVLAIPTGLRAAAEAALEHGAHVVSSCDDPAEVRSLLALDTEARERARSIVVGAAFAPGLSCLLAGFGATHLDQVTEVHVASAGTGGPACARRHHRALSSSAVDYNNGAWQRRPGGSGRELVWFPEPVGGADCYRAGLPDPVLLAPAFPGARKITARLEATRRDRLTTWLPMLRPPHPEGLVGAVRVEARGFAGGVAATVTVGASAPPALAAGAVAATTAIAAGHGSLHRPGAGGLAELADDPRRWLAELARRGVRITRFEGADALDGADEGAWPPVALPPGT